MRAPSSSRVRRILADPKAAREFMKQVITKQNDTFEIKLNGETERFARLTSYKQTAQRDSK